MASEKRVRAGRRSKRKGNDFEREVVNRLCTNGIQAERGYWQARGGEETPDVIVDGFWIEVSSGATADPEAKLDQAVKQARRDVSIPSVLPVAVTRKKGSRSIVATMQFNDLAQAVQANLYGIADFAVSFDFQQLVKIIGAAHGKPQKRSTD